MKHRTPKKATPASGLWVWQTKPVRNAVNWPMPHKKDAKFKANLSAVQRNKNRKITLPVISILNKKEE